VCGKKTIDLSGLPGENH
jgi:hypothetical protein